MRRTCAACLLMLLPLLPAPLARGGDAPLVAAVGGTARPADKFADRITAAIDRHLAADWAARKITPAPPADDAEFCRRAYLDLLGRIPKVAEARGFIDDTTADKRRALVDSLLKRPGYAAHQAAVVRAAWLPDTLTDPFKVYGGQAYEAWLRKKLAAGAGLDAVVRDTLTAKVSYTVQGQFRVVQQGGEYDPDKAALAAFYQLADVKPEVLGATASRAFLGVKLECAQCHDHPFAPYKRERFWEFAAFFGEFGALPPTSPGFVGPLRPQYDRSRLDIPGTAKQVSAKFSDGTEPDWSAKVSPREELARWIASPENPYFARNLVNRTWHQMFGVGLIDPVDEPGDANPPSHPELLDELAKAFADSGFDTRTLLRGIAASRPYQLTSRQTDPSQADPRRLARMTLKGLTGGQIYDSFAAATGLRNGLARGQDFYPELAQVPSRSTFAALFPTAARPTEAQTSILQALAVMNGRLTAEQTSLDKSEVLAAVIDSPFLDDAGKVDTLFLAALSRTPTADEREKFDSYVKQGGPSGKKDQALADVFWVLLNSTEFLFNH